MADDLNSTIQIAYPVSISDALRRLGPDVDDMAEEALKEIAEGTVALYQGQIMAVKAIDTGYFINTVHVRSATSRFEREIASEAPYSGIVEHGWIYRGKGQESYPGRFPAARTIPQLAPIIGDAFAHQLGRR